MRRALRQPGVDADRGVEVGVLAAEDVGHRARRPTGRRRRPGADRPPCVAMTWRVMSASRPGSPPSRCWSPGANQFQHFDVVRARRLRRVQTRKPRSCATSFMRVPAAKSSGDCVQPCSITISGSGSSPRRPARTACRCACRSAAVRCAVEACRRALGAARAAAAGRGRRGVGSDGGRTWRGRGRSPEPRAPGRRARRRRRRLGWRRRRAGGAGRRQRALDRGGRFEQVAAAGQQRRPRRAGFRKEMSWGRRRKQMDQRRRSASAALTCGAGVQRAEHDDRFDRRPRQLGRDVGGDAGQAEPADVDGLAGRLQRLELGAAVAAAGRASRRCAPPRCAPRRRGCSS